MKMLLWFCLCSTALSASPIQPKVLFYGDSNTYNWKLPSNSNAFQVNRNWNNQGVAAPATSAELLARFGTDVVSFHPTVVHIMAGYFDIRNVCEVDCITPEGQTTLAEAISKLESNTRQMVTLAEKNGIKIVLGTVPPFMPAMAPLGAPVAYQVYDYNNGWLKPYAATQHIPVVDYNAILGYYLSPDCDQYAAGGGCDEGPPGTVPYEWYTNDGINPNSLGYALMTTYALIAVDIADLALKSGYLGTPGNVNVISLSEEQKTDIGIGFTPYGVFSDGVTRPLDALYLSWGNQTWTSSNVNVLDVNPLYGATAAVGLGKANVRVKVNGVPFSPWTITVVP